MKNQYFGDVKDFCKYGLLRTFASAGLSTGVCWMLTPDDGSTHGADLRYLADSRTFRVLDPELFDALGRICSSSVRRTVELASELLPSTRFFSEEVPHTPRERRDWWQRALQALDGLDLVFLDPDNGIETMGSGGKARRSAKHVDLEEVAEAWTRGLSTLVFQHYTREMPWPELVDRQVARLSKQIPGCRVRAVRTTHVAFLAVPNPRHEERVDAALRSWRLRGWESAR